MTAAFLSEEWFAALTDTLATVVVGEEADDGLALGQVVHGGPDGTVRFTIRVGRGVPAEVVRGGTESAQVTLVEDFESARQIAEGAPVADLLASGRIKVSGDANALLRASGELGALATALQ